MIKNGDNHYDIVSAFIKSMRGSDPDAALHYLARMLVAGRRYLILLLEELLFVLLKMWEMQIHKL